MRTPAAVDAARSSATSGPSDRAPPRMASPICLEAALRSALRPSDSDWSRRRRRIDVDGPVDQRRVLALVDGALADPIRLLAEPLHTDAHAVASPVACGARLASAGG